MKRLVSVALLSAALALGGASVASAQSAQAVQVSGNTFHKRVCPAPIAGEAQCHAHVVTDASGNDLSNRSRNGQPMSGVTPNAIPSGYGPAISARPTTSPAAVVRRSPSRSSMPTVI